jgi:hypothetical protein
VSHANATSESNQHEDGDALLDDYDFESKNQKKKAQLRKFFHDVLGLWIQVVLVSRS